MSPSSKLAGSKSREFAANREAQLDALENVRALEKKVAQLSARQASRFHDAGKLLPRERVDQLLDPGSEFLSLSPLAGLGIDEDDGKEMVTGGGLITGIGRVSGVRAMIIANDSAIKGGTMGWAGALKHIRAQEIALRQKLPVLNLVESGGGNLLLTHKTHAVLGGKRFAGQARLAAAGIPQITIVHGNATAGGAYAPGMSDRVILVRNQSRMFLAGPPLLKMATGEIADDEELGGADMHSSIAGSAEWVAENDEHALAIAREVMAHLNWKSETGELGVKETRQPSKSQDDILGLVPMDYRTPYDVREVIACLTDASEFFEFKEAYDPYTICGQGEIEGFPCGFIGNNGPITAKGAQKSAQFIQLCDQSGIALVFLQNTTGFIVGKAAEEEGIIKHGAKLIQAVTNARVPRITMMIGASFGAGNYAMCGRGYDPDFLFAWPGHRIAVMGGEQAAGVLEIVARAGAKRRGKDADEDALATKRGEILEHYDHTSSALYSTSQLWDDGIIDPRDTRRVISLCLKVTSGARHRTLNPSTFGAARF